MYFSELRSNDHHRMKPHNTQYLYQHMLSTQSAFDTALCSHHTDLAENTHAGCNLDTKKKCWTSVCVTSCVLLCCLLSVSLSVYTLSVIKAMESQIGCSKDELPGLTTTESTGISRQQVSTEDRASLKQSERPIRRHRRNTTGQLTNFVHLVGTNLTHSTTNVDNMSVFRWKRSDLQRRVHGLSLLPHIEDITKIKILHPGVYLVYAQVELHGHTNLDVNYQCSHRTIRRRLHGLWVPILSSVLTQDNIGQEYRDIFSGGNFKPIDSQLHLGVFYLSPNDELSVRVPPHCTNSDYSMTPENTYFGVVKLG
uniref:THD domain-containing protein n=2 Tax=Arion vulgaris TaxID=1028688 RepID=A0A0B6ZWR5_9EUPU